jgi:hypothetical protein
VIGLIFGEATANIKSIIFIDDGFLLKLNMGFCLKNLILCLLRIISILCFIQFSYLWMLKILFHIIIFSHLLSYFYSNQRLSFVFYRIRTNRLLLIMMIFRLAFGSDSVNFWWLRMSWSMISKASTDFLRYFMMGMIREI